ncbi:class II fructose-bisphosphate aldolase [Streptomyces sp.]|uniref:class II fructose-bisphosphate aldolase n=1 Tax=Streptomyces sp. TaxID=1931 RepID=UPI002F41416A
MSVFALGPALRSAMVDGYAMPACNVFDAVSMDAVLAAGERLVSPVVVQISTRTLRAWGPVRLRRMFDALSSQRDVSALLHLDHCDDPATVIACMEAGWNSALFDASALDVELAVRLTRDLVLRGADRDFHIEGEIDRIVSAADAHTGEVKIDIDRSVNFVERTGVACFSPAAGTVHGVPVGPVELDWDGLTALAQRTRLPLVLHGGSELDTTTLRRAVTCGVAKVNLSSALKTAFWSVWAAYRTPPFIEPTQLLQQVFEGVEDVVARHVEAVGSKGRACAER